MPASIDDTKLSGTVDMVVTTGFQKPKKPFFVFTGMNRNLKKIQPTRLVNYYQKYW
jgi:hypothetical protein